MSGRISTPFALWPGIHAFAAVAVSSVLCLLGSHGAADAPSPVVIGAESKTAPDPRQDYARYVRFRPADGETVSLNPPRFSWPYLPDIVFSESAPASQRFTLQIAKTEDFSRPDVEVKDTPCNFYNFLPELKGAKTWHWRVGYNIGTKDERWSAARSFTLADNAAVWDRSRFPQALDAVHGHPRILFNAGNRDEILRLRDSDPYSAEAAKAILAQADKTLQSGWFQKFPKDDSKRTNYMTYSDGLVDVGFAYLLTRDPKYAGFKERLLTMASWPKGGRSSPEGLNGTDKWQTHLTEHMGLLYDWFYGDLTAEERAVIRDSLQWRLDWTLNNFAWRGREGKSVPTGSIAAQCGSHPYQNIMAILPGALAVCDEVPVARQALEIGVHYLVGITNAHGEDEAWGDGAGYGNGKMKWLTNATWCLQTAVPALDLGKNDAYDAYVDFFARLTPVGAQHCSFGNRGYSETDWSSSRLQNLFRVALLRQNGQAMQNWLATRQRMADLGRNGWISQSPYIDCVLPYYAKAPKPALEANPAEVFPLEGWVCVSGAPPSDYEAQKNAVSMTFACRPRGGTGHSFRNENAFDIHAYGQTLACGGDNTYNLNPFANHTMSHNTILVNGREQEAAKDKNVKTCGRIIAFRQGDGFVYWAGDATPAYGPATGLGKFVRHVVFVDNAYFVMFDDLAMAPGAAPATFQWLCHAPKCEALDFDAERFAVRYSIGEASIVVQHLAGLNDLQLLQLHGEEGMKNPITGEAVGVWGEAQEKRMAKKRETNEGAKAPPHVDGYHLWVTTRTPRPTARFLAVIAPFREGEPAPKIEPLSDTAARVAFRGKQTVVSFDKASPGDITVDRAAIAPEGHSGRIAANH